MRRLLLLVLPALAMSGCVMGIPDANPPVKPPKPCEVWIIERPDNTARCVTRDEFGRLMKGVLY